MTLKDWVSRYEKKVEEPFQVLPGFNIYLNSEKGFFCWSVRGNCLEVDHTCTNDRHWVLERVTYLALREKCSVVRTLTSRNPAAYMRLFKGVPNLSLSGTSPVNGRFYWVFEKSITELVKATGFLGSSSH